MNILSVQSWVSYGHVGNAAAVFVLQRLGDEAWGVNSVHFSNHTGYGHVTGERASGAQVAALLAGIEALGVWARCDGVLSGYLGSAAVGAAVLAVLPRIRRANPAVRYCCDPVLGERDRGLFVTADCAAFLREQALAAADLLTPNHFELEWLSGLPVATLAAAKQAARRLAGRMCASGPASVLATGLTVEETPPDAIDMLLVEGDGAWRLRTPRLRLAASGAGDALAALWCHHRLAGQEGAPWALEAAASALHGLLRQTAAQDQPELLLGAAQEELVRPSRWFHAEPV
jgi:pyridoxine kinase